ncbi:methylmalonyl-CoA mutase [Flavobacteriaceae bacterium Ap0902]|nr:methylmalonyl-CoA mutase [Flavobacteriaceae bacterium Ap0902]
MKTESIESNRLVNQIYQPQHHIRIVTAAALFDGHDASINIMRRIIQRTGVEVIHLGHDRSVEEVVNCAIQEDAQAIAITSYQGGHNEYFKYMYDLLQEKGAGHIKIVGGGGGVILPEEIKDLMAYGITRIYSPDDGRSMGLQGMINDMVSRADFGTGEILTSDMILELNTINNLTVAQTISAIENHPEEFSDLIQQIANQSDSLKTPVIGITGTGGAGKSSLVDEIVRRFLMNFPDKKLGIISVDPTKRKTGGALLGDRIRMNSINHPNVYMRSMATRSANSSISKHVAPALDVLKVAGYDLLILETSGIGQSGAEVLEYADLPIYVMTPEYGAATQLEKIDMLDFAQLVVLNKTDKKGALDALRDVKKQYQRNHELFDQNPNEMPVYATRAAQFNDPGTNEFYVALIAEVNKIADTNFEAVWHHTREADKDLFIIPPKRVRYLSEIAEESQRYEDWVAKQTKIADQLYALKITKELEINNEALENKYEELKADLHRTNLETLENWEDEKARYAADEYIFKVRDREIKIKTHTETLSHTQVPKVSLPRYKGWGDILNWTLRENVPGKFPYTAGIYPFKREGEDPTRMFAGEGGPERTNKRFHYVSFGMPAKRLSTAFDSVTLYGQDPDERPDIYGKTGNAGVSIATLDDAKKLYAGFDLSNPKTSVSMTINGPAAMLLGFFMNAAIDQNCEKFIKENRLENKVETRLKEKFDDRGLARPQYQGDLPKGNNGLGLMLLGLTGDEILEPSDYNRIKEETLKQVRGTVQADILKEDQAQNTCIFSTEFALKLMGDVQYYFIEEGVRNFYSVSISGYHIAEAGANPITQLAFTLANGFTYVEYYLSRGMDINKFAPNLSFFFSNGIDAEYAVIGRVARRIWAKAMKNKYEANERSQMLKYHIQTSGRSLHAQEIDFNDIRTTLQALYAIYDNCNSLHTNAYDEAITTPTEASVRRAMAIQLIINKELGLAKNENPIQGSFIIEELTDLVEEAVYAEFDRLTERGGVLGAMETMYQRGKIQEESLYYETLKHTGEYPIIGVNTFLSKDGSPTVTPGEVIRSTEEEKEYQIKSLRNYQDANKEKAKQSIKDLKNTALNNGNIFESLMTATKYCSLGEITTSLYEIGGRYRRNM